MSDYEVRDCEVILSRIAWFSWRNAYHPLAGGEEHFVHEVSNRLVRLGHQVTVVSCKSERLNRKSRGVEYQTHEIGSHDSYIISAWLYWIKYHNAYDVLIEDTSKIPLYLPSSRKIIMVHHLNRSIYFNELSMPKSLLGFTLETLMPRLYTLLFPESRFLAVSRFTKMELIKMGVNEEDIRVIKEGVTSNYSPSVRKTAHPSVCMVSRLSKYKRPDHAILAFSKVLKFFPNAEMFIVGDGEMSNQLKILVQNRSLENNVRLLGRVPDEVKFEIMQKSWLNLVTSEKEGWGLVVIEAAISSTPTIAYANSGLLESVVNNVTGILVKDGNSDDLAEGIIRMFNQTTLLANLSENARKYATQFSWDFTALEIQNIVQSLTSR